MQLGCAWNRNDPRLLGKQPGKRELSRCHLPLFRKFAEQINQRLVSFTVLRVKAWDGVAEIRVKDSADGMQTIAGVEPASQYQIDSIASLAPPILLRVARRIGAN